MLLILGTIRIPADKLDRARPIMARMIAASRAEEGCLDYSYAEDVLVPGLIHVAERWTARDALERHFQQPHLAEWRSAWPELGLTDRQLFLYESSGPQAV
jgi:quinol monooxygenase YgiN